MKTLTKTQAEARVDRLMNRQAKLVDDLLKKARHLQTYRDAMALPEFEYMGIDDTDFNIQMELIESASSVMENEYRLMDAFEAQEAAEKAERDATRQKHEKTK